MRKEKVTPRGRPAEVKPINRGMEEQEQKVLRVKRYAAKPMSVDDAILEMDLLGHSFYMFSNVETGNAATVYRRKDGGCGLIELENL